MATATNKDVNISESRKNHSNNVNIEEESYHGFQNYDGDIIVKLFEDGRHSTNFSKMLNSQS